MKFIGIKVIDIMVLLDHVRLGASMPDVGFEDANQTYDSMLRKLNKVIALPVSDVESALWSANLLDERGKFSHPEGLTFDEFVSKLKKDTETFNKNYNFWESKDGQ